MFSSEQENTMVFASFMLVSNATAEDVVETSLKYPSPRQLKIYILPGKFAPAAERAVEVFCQKVVFPFSTEGLGS